MVSSKTQSELKPRSIFGGGPPKKMRKTEIRAEFERALYAFLVRGHHERIKEHGDGHCGARSMARQAVGVHLKKGMHDATWQHIFEARNDIARALENQKVDLVQLLGAFGVTSDGVEARANLHKECAAWESCNPDFYVGGDNSIDFIA